MSGADEDVAFLRYRSEEAVAALRRTPAIDALFAHPSVRAYLPDPLPTGTLETLVAAAQSAASSSNLQVWSVIAVEDATRKARLAALAGNQRHIVEAPLLLVWLIDFDRLTQLGRLYGTPPGALAYTESLLLGAVDTAIAAQNAVVALEALGLGSVYIGGIRNRPEAVAAELGLPSRLFPLFGLVVGSPDPARPAAIKPRLPHEAVLHRERYTWSNANVQAVARYNVRLRELQREQGITEEDWSTQALRRAAGPASMAGGHEIRDSLARLGFPLE